MNSSADFFAYLFLAVGVVYLLIPRVVRAMTWGWQETIGWKPVKDHPFHSLWLYRLGGVVAILVGVAILTGRFDSGQRDLPFETFKTEPVDPDEFMENLFKNTEWITTTGPASAPSTSETP